MGPEKIEDVKGGGCLSLFGVPFLLAGLGTMFGPIIGLLAKAPGSLVALPFTFLFGLPFAVVGGALVFGRAGYTIDPQRRKVRTWWRILFYESSTEYGFDAFKKIVLSRETRGSKNKITVFPVKLTGTDKPLELCSPQDYDLARADSEKFGKCMQLPVEDATGDQVVTRDPEHLDESFQDRVARTGEKLRFDPKCPGGRILFESHGEKAGFILPQVGMTLSVGITIFMGIFVGVVVFGVMIIPMGYNILVEKNAPEAFRIAQGLFCLFLLTLPGGLIFNAFRAMTTRERLLVGPSGVLIEHTDCIGKSVTTYRAGDIEEVVTASSTLKSGDQSSGTIIPDRVITLRIDKGTAKVGNGLTGPELQWLANAIKYHLQKTSGV